MNAAFSTRAGSRLYRSRRVRGFTLIEFLVVFAIIALLAALLLPSVRTAGPSARRAQCQNNLRQIALALHNYHDAYGTLPPAYTVDADGRPLQSWRTLILPFLDQKALYDTIDLSKPWDDPANKGASETSLWVYRCPEFTGSAGQTTYLAVVADGSCFRPAEGRPFSEVTDGLGETLLVIETDAAHAVHWMAPSDADEALVLAFGPKGGVPHAGGTHGLLADGSVRFLSAELPADQRRALISAAGGDGEVLQNAE